MFENRADAGKQLAQKLTVYRGEQTVVYGLPRGGVIVAAEVARLLPAPLDVIVVRKIGHPNNPEYAIASVTEGAVVKNESEVGLLNAGWFRERVTEEQKEIARRCTLYTNGKTISANGKVAIVVDDGLATGLSMRAALQSVRLQKPKKIVVAVPVAPRETLAELKTLVNEIVALLPEENFLGAVGAYYQDFEQVSDAEVTAALKSQAYSVIDKRL